MSISIVEGSPSRTGVSESAGEEKAVVTIYPAFFRAGILAVLTTGCLLGAIALVGVSLRQSYSAADWTPYILAHANSQLYGWVGLFVMGFALQQHPPRVARIDLFYRLANIQRWLLIIAVILRFVAEPLSLPTAPTPSRIIGLTLGILTGILQAAAVILFGMNIGRTRYRGRDHAGLPWQTWFVLAALGWWLVAALVDPWVFWAMHGSDAAANAAFVAARLSPYRDAQFLGFVPQMIFGVSLALFDDEFGLHTAYRKPGVTALALWNIGLLIHITGLMLWNDHSAPIGLTLYHTGGFLLAVSAILVVYALGIFARRDRAAVEAAPGTAALWFTRTAYLWLLIAGIMIVAEPFVLAPLHRSFTHAYTGGLRHVLTVGFISQMILGVALHIVPRWQGRPSPAALTGTLMAAFILLNLGNALRVILEVATDFIPSAFLPMGVTGFIELTALVLWAAHLFRELRLPNAAAMGKEG